MLARREDLSWKFIMSCGGTSSENEAPLQGLNSPIRNHKGKCIASWGELHMKFEKIMVNYAGHVSSLATYVLLHHL